MWLLNFLWMGKANLKTLSFTRSVLCMNMCILAQCSGQQRPDLPLPTSFSPQLGWSSERRIASGHEQFKIVQRLFFSKGSCHITNTAFRPRNPCWDQTLRTALAECYSRPTLPSSKPVQTHKASISMAMAFLLPGGSAHSGGKTEARFEKQERVKANPY